MKYQIQIAILLSLLVISNCITQPKRGSDTDPSLEPKTKITQSYSGTDYQMKLIYNSKGGYLNQAAKNLGVQEADLGGILKVESSGKGFTASTGLMIIRFENHWFYKLYTNYGKDSSRVATFNKYFKYDSGSTWKGHQWYNGSKWVSFHGNQNLEWQVLKFAQGLDDGAAIQSASYGIAQIMGFNYKTLGYSTPQKMFLDFSGSIKAQMDGMFNFIKNQSKCYKALKSNPTNYYNFASCYNGSGQASTYGKLISQASASYSKVTKNVSGGGGNDPTPTPTPSNKSLKSGDLISFTSVINIRTQPKTSGGNMGKTYKGQQAVILSGPSSSNGYQWYFVQFVNNSKKGYVAYKSSWFYPYAQFRKNDTVKATTKLYLRKSPGGSAVTQLKKGTKATVTGKPVVQDGHAWYPLRTSGFLGKKGYSAMGNGYLTKA